MRYNYYTREQERREQGPSTPERRLLVALLRRAILDYLGGDPLSSVEAREWFFDDGNQAGNLEQFTFAWVCEQLGLDGEEILDQIVALTGDPDQLRAFRKLN